MDDELDTILGVCYCGHDSQIHWDNDGCMEDDCFCDEYIERFRN